MHRLATLASALFLLAGPILAQGEASIEMLFDELPNGVTSATPFVVSGDGSTLAGGMFSNENGTQAFRWTTEGGFVSILPFLDRSGFSEALDLSTGGSVVVGIFFPPSHCEAFRWEDNRVQRLGDLFDPPFCSQATGVSGDGSVVVGTGTSDVTGLNMAFRWTEDDGMVALSFLEGHEVSSAADISADGSVIVGTSGLDNNSESEAFRWEDSVMTGLGVLEGGTYGGATAVSADGSTIVGTSSSSDGNQAFRWTEENGMVGLGDLPGGGFSSSATDVSDDGSVVVGSSRVLPGGTPDWLIRAFIWRESTGMLDLKTVLEDEYGLDMTGWELYEARSISDDGTVIIGIGRNAEDEGSWRAFLGTPIASETVPENSIELLTTPTPNPATASTSLSLRVPEAQHVRVEIFDALGHRVRTLYDGALVAGTAETLMLDASALPAGVYVVRAQGEDFTRTQRVTVIR